MKRKYQVFGVTGILLFLMIWVVQPAVTSAENEPDKLFEGSGKAIFMPCSSNVSVFLALKLAYSGLELSKKGEYLSAIENLKKAEENYELAERCLDIESISDEVRTSKRKNIRMLKAEAEHLKKITEVLLDLAEFKQEINKELDRFKKKAGKQ